MGAEAAVCLLCGHTEGEHGGRGCSNGWATDVRGCGCLHFAPSPLAHSLTPSEVALARMLSAWVEWIDQHWATTEKATGPGEAMLGAGMWFAAHGLCDGQAPTPTGAALLDKARKAGVL